jgi:Protein of unknown function (DUF3572)
MINKHKKNLTLSPDAAVEMAQDFVTFLASDDDRLTRFLAASGIDQGQLRDQLSDPSFLGFILDFALQDEAQILEFAANRNLAPETILQARSKLPGANLDF